MLTAIARTVVPALVLSAAPAHAAKVYYTLTNQGTGKCLTGGIGTAGVATCKAATYTQE